jgi:hypothetical protein
MDKLCRELRSNPERAPDVEAGHRRNCTDDVRILRRDIVLI